MLGVSDDVRAFLFDLDGVLTQTAKVHAAAWKQMFDEYLQARAATTGETFRPFDIHDDYDDYVDGKPRADGTRSFLESRNISLPEGNAEDSHDAETINGLGNRKNELVLEMIKRDGVEAYPGSVKYLEAVRDAVFRGQLSRQAQTVANVLVAAGIDQFFNERVDGVVAEKLHLKGKPAPDTFLAAAAALGVDASRAVVFEDALAGVAAGKAGNFVSVVGVDRVGHAEALAEHGATIVVSDLQELLS